jgi:hypothetical protein
MRGTRLFRWSLGAVLGVCLAPGWAAADVEYKTVSHMEFSGGLGKVVGFMGRLGGAKIEDLAQTVSLSGDRMRTDDKDNSTIVDLAAQRMIFLNHPDKSYQSMTFAEAQAMIAQLGTALSQKQAEKPPEDSGVKVEYEVDAERTGKKQEINGFQAEQLYLTLSAKTTAAAAAAPDGKPAGATMVFVSELWMSDQVPGYDQIQAFGKRAGEALGQSLGGGQLQGLGSMLGDRQLAAGLEKVAAEIARLPGMEVQNTTWVVSVPAGQKFQRELVFGAEKKEEKKKKKGFGGLGKLVKQAVPVPGAPAEEQEEAASPEAAAPQQRTVLTTAKKLTAARLATLDQALFAIPAGYRQQEMKLPEMK